MTNLNKYKMNFKKKYKEETGKSVNGTIVNRLIHLQYSEDYVNWLEQQLILSGVGGMFSAEKLEQAYDDGIESEKQRCGVFEIENYR